MSKKKIHYQKDSKIVAVCGYEFRTRWYNDPYRVTKNVDLVTCQGCLEHPAYVMDCVKHHIVNEGQGIPF